MKHTPSPFQRTRFLFTVFLLCALAFVAEQRAASDQFLATVSARRGFFASSRSISSVASTRSRPKVFAHPASSKSTRARNSIQFAKQAAQENPVTRREFTAQSSSSSYRFKPSATYAPAPCGDGIMIDSETCDDGNQIANDGCSAKCLLEAGYQCDHSVPMKCWGTCGDGVVAVGVEKCDDGNRDSEDGCSALCKIEMNYKCTGSPSVCKIPAFCGNSLKEEGEDCDDGNSTGGDGCSASCKKE